VVLEEVCESSRVVTSWWYSQQERRVNLEWLNSPHRQGETNTQVKSRTAWHATCAIQRAGKPEEASQPFYPFAKSGYATSVASPRNGYWHHSKTNLSLVAKDHTDQKDHGSGLTH
jgi:hypothetical protein